MKLLKFTSIFAIVTASCNPVVKVAAEDDPNRAAGFLFVCLDDRSVFLGKRSRHVSEPGVWSTFGGGAKKDETDLEAAKREVIEEAGSMPKIKRILAKTVNHKPNEFTYTTFVAEVSEEEKNNWKPKLNFETESAQWFKELPDNLHPGLVWSFEQIMRK